jgi:hypothetical protein
VTSKVSKDLGKVALVEINVNKEKTIKVLLRLDDQASIRSVDTSMPIVDRGVSLRLNTLGSVNLETLNGQTLEGCKSPCTSLNGVFGSDEIRSRIGIVGSRIRMNLTLLARVDRPSSNMNLLTSRDIEGLEERVHVLPAVQLAEATDISLADRHEGVARAITVYKLLDVGRLDLATMVDNIAVRSDEDLGEVESGVVNLREAERDIDLVIPSGATDAAHFLGVDSHGVLAVSLDHGKGLEVGYLPHPVGITGDP